MYSSISDKLRFVFLRKVVAMSTLAVIVGFCLALFYLSDRYHIAILSVLGGILFLLGLVILIFTLPEVFARMEEEGTFLFGSAIAHTLYGYAMRLSFLPIIGSTLERFVFHKKEKNPFLIENEKRK